MKKQNSRKWQGPQEYMVTPWQEGCAVPQGELSDLACLVGILDREAEDRHVGVQRPAWACWFQGHPGWA